MALENFLQHLKPDTFIRYPEPEDVFLEAGTSCFTYGSLYSIALSLKGNIEKYGISCGPESPLLIPAFPSESLVLFLAACRLLNITVFPFNPEYNEKEIAGLFEHFPNSNLVNLTDEKNSISLSLKGTPAFAIPKDEEVYFDSEVNSFRNLANDPERILIYLHTSGTSGPAKIVPVKNRQLLFAAQANAHLLWPAKNEKWLLCLPLHHIGGLSIIGRTLLYGSAIYYMDKFDEKTLSYLLSNDTTVKTASLVPTMLKRALDAGLTGAHSNLTGLLLGGGPLDASLIQRAQQCNIPLVSSYGMTETCAQIAAHKITEYPSLPNDGSITGTIFHPNEIQVRNENGTALGNREGGFIHIKGPQVFDGYLSQDQGFDNELFDEECFFNTGDFGYLDAHGRLIIQSRRTDLIVTGGENVSPFEVESALEDLEEIEEAVVFGLPDQVWGRKVAAAILQEKATTKLDVATVKERLSDRLKSYQIPKAIFHRLGKFPRTSTGKLKRKEISDYYHSLESDSQ